MSNLDPQIVYEALKGQMKTKRSLRSLEAIHEVCREHREAGAFDFKAATIARLGAGRGVPSEQTIKNKTGEPYRALIKAWQECVPNKPKPSRKRDDWLADISDPRIRFLVEDLVARNRKLEQQIAILRKAEFTIDLRETAEVNNLPEFIDSEIDALKKAISTELFDKMRWESDSRGRVTDAKGSRIYGPGYVTAIEKMLSIEPK